MKTVVKNWPTFITGLYTGIVTTFFGAILLDVVYSRLVLRALDPSETAAIFSPAADFLLLIGSLAVLAGIVAIGSAWRAAPARNLMLVSFLFLMTEFLMPMLFAWLFPTAQVDPGPNPGPWIRLVGSALSSVLAFLGLFRLDTSRS